MSKIIIKINTFPNHLPSISSTILYLVARSWSEIQLQ